MEYEVETDEAIHKWTDQTRAQITDQIIIKREYRSQNNQARIQITEESSENQARIPATIIGIQTST